MLSTPTDIARIYVGVHYPSDVVVGALFGILAAWMVHKIMIPRLSGSAIIQGAGNHPWFYGIAFVVTFEIAAVFDDVRQAKSFGTTLLHHHLDQSGITGLIVVGTMFVVFIAIAYVLLRGVAKTLDRDTAGSSH